MLECILIGSMTTLLNLIPCYIGNEIQLGGNKLAQKLYEGDWMDSGSGHQKRIVVMQTILQVEPISVKIAGNFVINLEIFLNLINATYSLIACLRNLKN